jgi:hypothetical protein
MLDTSGCEMPPCNESADVGGAVAQGVKDATAGRSAITANASTLSSPLIHITVKECRRPTGSVKAWLTQMRQRFANCCVTRHPAHEQFEELTDWLTDEVAFFA